ncbi:uncharacterized protein ALTATR162_LOCUS10950 [Alternaria atra]|uniref:Uncharacterized protein n=1 Tax=Alternaria atra TaxID=119953 RepID=A0A8J2IAU9_9PLEO|nr:uncharacterized protein ALTATR162_LOCUS10950 [Alternaria atra]CAG5184520.1 unnamed protein product [Alternaria atra]
MRSSIFYLLAPLLTRAADVKMVGLGYRGGEAVQAGQDITLTITNATEAGSGYPGKKATHFRITIWNSIYMWNMCSLTGILPAKDGNVTVTIPPGMGPSGMYYEIGADGYSNPTNESWMNIISGKNTPFIYLAGGKGSWIPAETTPELKYQGLVGFENADIPCNSYPCAQRCAAKYFPLTSGWQEGSDWINCLTACEGVTINTSNDETKSPVEIAVNSALATPNQASKREGGRTNISWSPDGQLLEINGSQITLAQLRFTVHSLLDRIDWEARELMFHWWPDVDLRGIKDELISYRWGYSFLAEPQNNLQMSFKHLHRRAFSPREGRLALQGAGCKRALAYLQRCDDLTRLLFAGTSMTNGMPARGEELRIIRWANTVAVQRNIVIHKGRIMLLFAYNKVSTTVNHSFYIVWVPCPTVERALFLYLAYIRPFTDFLLRQLKLVDAETKTNLQLFGLSCHPTGCFSATDCSKSLEQATPDCPIRLQLSIYRHVAVAMSKKHTPTLLEPFDPNIPKDRNDFLHLLAFQTGHPPSVHATAYALERGYPARLQPELIDRYFENSFIWHRFLEITKERPIDKELNTGTLDQRIQKVMTPTTKPARHAADVGVPDEEPVVLGSRDQEIAEARPLERRPLRRSKCRLSSDPCYLHQNQSVSRLIGPRKEELAVATSAVVADIQG